MQQIEKEILLVKKSVMDMMGMVYQQLTKVKEAVTSFDTDLAEEIVTVEKKINAAELQIDRLCENTLALYTPVAVDLRFILAALKINTFLERMGDNIEGIAEYVIEQDKHFPKKLLEQVRFEEMCNITAHMLEIVMEAFETEDTKLARKLFKKDKEVDKINRQAVKEIHDYIIDSDNKKEFKSLNLLSCIRKLERVGDLAKNISEETIFYVDAKVLKHQKKK